MKRKTLPYHTQPQMFVFGEVQEPTQETVNLVEDIVRSQIIELVRPFLNMCYPPLTTQHRSYKPVL